MYNLNGGMHAGIRTTRGHDFNGMVGYLRDCRFHCALNAVRVCLGLPAGEGATVVFDPKRDARHDSEKKAAGSS